jgi:hypothetical protein
VAVVAPFFVESVVADGVVVAEGVAGVVFTPVVSRPPD